MSVLEEGRPDDRSRELCLYDIDEISLLDCQRTFSFAATLVQPLLPGRRCIQVEVDLIVVDKNLGTAHALPVPDCDYWEVGI